MLLLLVVKVALPEQLPQYIRASFEQAAKIDVPSDLALFFECPQSINNITFTSDVHFSSDEFFYLLGFDPKSDVSLQDLIKGIRSFFKKQKFFSIEVVASRQDDSIDLHFDFSSYWTFANLKIRGFLVGKDVYRQYYMIDTGDVFNEDRHTESIKKIKNALAREGYFKARVESFLERDYGTKSITTHLELHRGSKFSLIHRACVLEGDELSEVEISDIQHYVTRNFLKQLHGISYSKSRLNKVAQEVKKALARKGFLHVSIRIDEIFNHAEKKIGLCWYINVHRKRELVFFGNSFFSKQQLFEKIAEFGHSAWLLPAGILSEEITQAYKQKGFWDISIEAREEKGRSFFLIKEGDRSLIDRIELKNAHYFNAEMLIRKFLKRTRRRHFFDYDLLKQSFADLITFYCKHGFLDARILGYEFVKNDERSDNILVVTLEEGNQYWLGTVSIEGLDGMPPNEFYLPHAQDDGPISFDPTIVALQRQFLMEYMREQGYMQGAPRSEVVKRGMHVDVTWHIDHAVSPICFGKTILLGSSYLPFLHLKNMFICKDGALWDHESLRRTFRFFRGLDVFEVIQFMPDTKDEDSGARDVLFKLQEEDQFEVRVRAGVELQHVQHYKTLDGITYRIGGSFMVKNPFKRADHFRFDADITRAHRELVASYIQPWWFKIPLKTITKLYSIEHDHPDFVASGKNIYTVVQHGGLFSVQGDTQRVDAACNVGFEWMKTSIKDDSITMQGLADSLSEAINFDTRLLGEAIPYFLFEPTLFIDRLDNKLNPKQGTLTLISLKGMFPVGGVYPRSFSIKLLLEHSLFVPIKEVVLALRARFGHIFHQKFSAIMPIERFYLGGSHSLRGYDTDLAPPVSNFFDTNGKEHVVPRGGKNMLNINLELRVPVASEFGIVLFQDIGVLSRDNFADFTTSNMLASSGFGVRYNTPLGPLRFDIGWKWKKRVPAERSFAWFLSLGHAF